MNPRKVTHSQSFCGTLEQCVEHYGGKLKFTVSAPLTFFSGARLETHRRAQSKDGSVLIIEQQLGPTICEVYLQSAGIRPQSIRADLVHQSNCA
jgi:hypothetical protein